MTVFGMFGFIVVVGPASLKVLVGGVILYALVCLTWGFWQA